MKSTIIITGLLALNFQVAAQKFFTKEGTIKFYSEAKLEKIQAQNNKATCVLDAASGAMEWSVLINAFIFESAFMQEHFNETYMESPKYPKASFKGQIDNFAALNLKKDGSYPVKVTGELTMHGVTKKITVDGKLNVSGGAIGVDSKFFVKPSEHNISIPGDKKDSISGNIEVTVKGDLKELKK
jgi:hypothetical protein